MYKYQETIEKIDNLNRMTLKSIFISQIYNFSSILCNCPVTTLTNKTHGLMTYILY